MPSIELATLPANPELIGHVGGIQAQRRAGQRRRAVRADRLSPIEVPHPVDVAQQSPAVGQQVVGTAALAAPGCRWVRPGIGTPRWVVGLLVQRADDELHPGGQVAQCVAQVHPEEGGDLVVARPTGSQPAGQLGPEALEKPPLEGPVHVLVGRRGHHWLLGDLGVEQVTR